jgi:tetratricopeptide (TPR) repeat protein
MTRFIFALLFLLGGCHGRHSNVPFDPKHPEVAAEKLRKQLKRRPNDRDAARDLAHIEWMWLAKPGEAIARLERLAEQGDASARLSLLIIAEGRMDAEGMTRLSYALLDQAARHEGRDSAFVDAAAEVAARTLAKVHGDLQGDDKRFIAFYAKLDRRKLPFSVAQPLVSLRAAIARRLGEDYRDIFAEEGCVQSWESSAVLGTFGDLELERQESKPFKADATAPLVPLSCVTRVWNPTTRAGIRKLRTTLAVRGQELQLDVSGQESLRVYLDGEAIWRTDVTDEFPSRRRRVTVPVQPGEHMLEVAMSLPGEKAWLLVRATEADGTPVKATAGAPVRTAGMTGKPVVRRQPWPEPMQPVDGRLYRPLRLYLAIDAALADGDSDFAEQMLPLLDEARAFGEGYLVKARFERDDPTRSPTISGAREQSTLERSLQLRPDLDAAQLRLLEIMLGRGDDTEAIRALEKLPKNALRGLRGELLRFEAYRARGNEHLARQALARAQKHNPESCRVLMSKRQIAQELGDVKSEDALAKELSDCGGSIELRARLHETRTEWKQAEALWKEALERSPDDIDALEGLARIAAVQGDDKKASERLLKVLELNPLRAGAHVGLADLAIARGDSKAAREQLGKALSQLPHADPLIRTADTLGIPDDLMSFRVDGLAAIAAYRELTSRSSGAGGGAKYEGVSEVLVLDRSVARVYSNFGQRQIVHLVVHLLSKEALDRYGEITVPPGSRVLTLRSVKGSGEIVEPELVQGKEGLELRHLEVGDFVEYEYVHGEDPAGAMPTYVDVSTFRFQSLDIPYHRSELLVVHEPSMTLQVEGRKNPPEEKIEQRKVGERELVVRTFRADEVPRLGVEPGHRSLIDELPNVRVWSSLDVKAWGDNLAASIRYARRTNPELRRTVRRIVRGKKDERARLEALWQWVVENVDEAGDLATGATATLAARRGNRLMLLRAMMEVAGIDSELWLARDRHGPEPLPGGHPMIENYDAAMLAVPQGKRAPPLMVIAASKVMPLGYLTPGYAGSQAIRIPLRRGEKSGLVTVPAPPEGLDDGRHWDLSFAVDGSGRGSVKGTITLAGGEAVVWREALREVDRDRVNEVFQQAELGWLRGATLQNLVIKNERDLYEPLKLEFEASAESIGITQGGALVMSSVPLPLNLGARYTQLPRRVTGLVVAYAPRHAAQLRFELQGAKFTEVPAPTQIESKFGTFTRKVEGGEGSGAVVLSYDSQLRTGVVDPIAYEELSEFARRVEAEVQAPLRAEPR